jgi:hypothetical protein
MVAIEVAIGVAIRVAIEEVAIEGWQLRGGD